MSENNTYNRYLAGGMSGIVEVLATHPLDYLKTKKQEYTQMNIKDNFYQSLMKEKNLNLYRGVIPRMCGVAPMWLTFWGVQDNVNCQLGKNTKLSDYSRTFISSGIAGIFQTVIDNPIENMKIASITNTEYNIMKKPFGYGFTPTLLRNVGFATTLGTLGLINSTNDQIKNFFIVGTSGMIASVITQPYDYLKTHVQRTQQNLSIIELGKLMYNTPWRQQMAGGMNRSLLSFFSMGVGFVAFDNFYRILCKN